MEARNLVSNQVEKNYLIDANETSCTNANVLKVTETLSLPQLSKGSPEEGSSSNVIEFESPKQGDEIANVIMVTDDIELEDGLQLKVRMPSSEQSIYINEVYRINI